jgi:RNA polymerase sigma-70 factor, ECF subfamily
MGTFGLTLTAESTLAPVKPDFQEIYQRYSAAVYRTALRVTGNDADAEDVMQTVFMKLWNQPELLDGQQYPESYLRRAATNASIDLLRRKAVRPETAMESAPEMAGPAHTALLKEQVRRALGKLDAEDAALFTMRNLDGFSYDELAFQFGVERGTVASRLHRIKQALLEHMTR